MLDGSLQRGLAHHCFHFSRHHFPKLAVCWCLRGGGQRRWGLPAVKVLKSLQAEPWEDDQIDQLLAAADTSGDGELQIEEPRALARPGVQKEDGGE